MNVLSDAFAFYLTSNYCSLAGLALVLYEWIINLPREVETFWRGDASLLSASLYFATRSISVTMAAMTAMGLAPWSDAICARGTLAGDVLSFLSYILLAVFSALRAYALSKRRILSFVILVFFLVPSVTDAVRPLVHPGCPSVTTTFLFYQVRLRYLTSSVVVPALGCAAVDNTPPELILIFFIATRSCAVLAILADALLLAITWRVLGPPGQRGVGFGGKGLVYIMLRDGAIYFILLLILNAMDLIFITYAILRASKGISYFCVYAMVAVSVFRVFLPPVLVSRFLLDLQEAHQRKVVVLGSDNPLDASSLCSCVGYANRTCTQSRPALGALGATIDPVYWGPQDPSDEKEGEHATYPAPRCGSAHPEDDDKSSQGSQVSPPGTSASPNLIASW